MHRTTRQAAYPALALAAVLALFASLPEGSSAETLTDEDPNALIDRREQDLEAIEGQVRALSDELSAHQADRAALIEELEERERDVAALAVAARELDRLVVEQTALAEDLRQREARERDHLAAELGRLSELLRTAHAMGRGDVLRLLLNQQDVRETTRIMSYFAYFNRERVMRISAVETSAARLAALIADTEQELARLAELAEQQEQSRTRLVTARAERAAVLAALERTIVSREEDKEALERDAERLRRLVVHLRQRAQIHAELGVDRAPFSTLRGKLPWPVLGSHVELAFGARTAAADTPLEGVLLAAGEGEEVRAIHDGRVVYADWLRGFGMMVVIDHGDGYLSFYGHNEALLKEVGEWVAAAEVIALSGSSGGRASAVLYFAIRHNGDPIDPSRWCG